MGDYEENGGDQNEMFDISKLSETEKRRLRRRQRILDNQGARLSRIVNNDSSDLKEGEKKTKLEFELGSSSSTVNLISTKGVTSSCNENVKAHKRRNSDEQDKIPSFAASIFQELAGTTEDITDSRPPPAAVTRTEEPPVQRLGVQSDGTVILPKISEFYGHVLICCVAVFLSVLNAKRYLITFFSWEIAFYCVNGLPPLPPPNMMMLLAAVMGLKEAQIHRVKIILHFCNCVMLDFSLFLTFIMLPHFVRYML